MLLHSIFDDYRPGPTALQYIVWHFSCWVILGQKIGDGSWGWWKAHNENKINNYIDFLRGWEKKIVSIFLLQALWGSWVGTLTKLGLRFIHEVNIYGGMQAALTHWTLQKGKARGEQAETIIVFSKRLSDRIQT